MSDGPQRATGDRQAGSAQARGLADPPRLATRCYRREIVLPATYAAFEARVERWIATCVMSRTEVNRAPIRREHALVRGNPTLLAVWHSIRHLQGEAVPIKADYVWGETRVEFISFSAVLPRPAERRRRPSKPRIPEPKPPTPEPPEPKPPEPEDGGKKEPPPPPPPEKHKHVDPPPSRPKEKTGPGEMLDYGKKVLDFLKGAAAAATLAATLAGLVIALDALLATLPPALVAILLWDPVARRIVFVESWGALTEAQRQLVLEHMDEIRKLQQTLSELEDALDDFEEIDIGEPHIPPGEPEVTVPDVPRGEAVEHFHLGRLANQGYVKLPRNWRGIDAIRGEYELIQRGGKRVKLYTKPDAVSIKSTRISDPKDLLSKFRSEYLPPLRGRYVEERLGLRIEGLGNKELHLIFEEGGLSGLRPAEQRALERALKDMATEARKSNVRFRWFAFHGGAEKPGPEFLELLKLGEE